MFDDYSTREVEKGNKAITFAQFEQWVEHFSDEDFMARQAEAMLKLDDDLFKRQRI